MFDMYAPLNNFRPRRLPEPKRRCLSAPSPRRAVPLHPPAKPIWSFRRHAPLIAFHKWTRNMATKIEAHPKTGNWEMRDFTEKPYASQQRQREGDRGPIMHSLAIKKSGSSPSYSSPIWKLGYIAVLIMGVNGSSQRQQRRVRNTRNSTRKQLAQVGELFKR